MFAVVGLGFREAQPCLRSLGRPCRVVAGCNWTTLGSYEVQGRKHSLNLKLQSTFSRSRDPQQYFTWMVPPAGPCPRHTLSDVGTISKSWPHDFSATRKQLKKSIRPGPKPWKATIEGHKDSQTKTRSLSSTPKRGFISTVAPPQLNIQR